MQKDFLGNNINYKIFDKSFKASSHIYSKYNAKNSQQVSEVNNNCDNISRVFGKDNSLLIMQQIHGVDIIDADDITDFECEPIADGAVTTKTNVILAIQTADCVPLLLAGNGVIGAAHCGWRGSKNGIISNIINLMRNKGAKEIRAVIGPCIHQESYEVDEQYYNSFISDNSENSTYFIPSVKKNHFMFDLPTFIRDSLYKNEVSDIYRVDEDTYSNYERYPSYRLATQSAAAATAVEPQPLSLRMLSAIMMTSIL